MPELMWWHWVVLGIVLMLGELAVPAFFLVWFGAAAIAVGIVVLAIPSFPFALQIVTWTVLAVLLIWFWFKVFKRGHHKTRAGISRGTFIGEIGLVIQDIRPFDTGRIRFPRPILGDDTWESISDQEIGTGERVRVVDVDGNLLKVRKIAG